MGTDLVISFFTQHPYLSGLLVEVSGMLIDKRSTWLGKKLFPKKSEFAQAIVDTYKKSLTDIRHKIAAGDDDAMFLYAHYFFRSPKFIETLVNTTVLDQKIDVAQLIVSLQQEGYTVKLTEENVTTVIDIFKKNLVADVRLRELEIKERYPHKIFGIDSKLDVLLSRLQNNKLKLEKRLIDISAATSHDANLIDRLMIDNNSVDILLHDVYVERDIEAEIKHSLKVSDRDSDIVIVQGEAGSGKTSLLWHLYEYYTSETDFYPLFIKAIHLHLYDIMSYLEAISLLDRKVILFVDTLDLLLHDSKDTQRLIDLLYAIVRHKAIFVGSTRPQEIKALYTVNKALQTRTYTLGNYDEHRELPRAIVEYAEVYYSHFRPEQREEVIKQAINTVAGNHSLKNLCLNPLTNRMLFSLYAPNNLPPEINVFKLYQNYWDRKVSSDKRSLSDVSTGMNVSRDLSNAARKIALLMLSQGNVSIHLFANSFLLEKAGVQKEDLNLLLDRGILRQIEMDGYIEFFHQTFFEHTAARALLYDFQAQSFDMLAEKLETGEDQQEYFYFVAPIYEQLLLLSENTILFQKAHQYLLELLTSGRAEKIRSGIYVFALLDNNDENLMNAVVNTFRNFNRDDSVYVKRFLQVAPNISNKRLPRLFGILDIIWDRNNWNEQFNLVELLEYLTVKMPTEVLKFVKKKSVVTRTISIFRTKGKGQGHQESLRRVGRILVSLYPLDGAYCLEQMDGIFGTVDALGIGEVLNGLIIEQTENIVLLNDVYQRVQKYISNAKGKTDERLVDLTARYISVIWAGEGKTIFDQLSVVEKSEGILRVFNIRALSYSAVHLTKEDALILFHHFKGIAEPREIFLWGKWLLRNITNHECYISPFEGLFFEDAKALLLQQNLESFTKQDMFQQKVYVESIARSSDFLNEKLFVAFEEYYTDLAFLEKFDWLSRMLIWAQKCNYLKGIFFHSSSFQHNNDLSRRICSMINDESLLDDVFIKIAIELCICHRQTSLLASIFERLCHSYGLFIRKDEVPAYLNEYAEVLISFAIANIRTNKVPEKTDAAHLLVSLMKLHLVKPISLGRFDEIFGNEKRRDVLSWIMDIYPFCSFATIEETTEVLERCKREFASAPKISNKARCAFLHIIYNSTFNFSAIYKEFVSVYLTDLGNDHSETRLKIVNRIIFSYAEKYPSTAFNILFELLNSPTFLEYGDRKQNETVHELYRGCIAVCRSCSDEELAILVDYLNTATCSYGKLALDGLASSTGKISLIKAKLNDVLSSAQALPCIRDYIHNLTLGKLRMPTQAGQWPELLNSFS